MVGKTLSHYKIVSELGRGGMGIVYRADDTKLDRSVAIKVLPTSALSSEEDRARFFREAKAAAKLHHQHIASVFEIDEAVPDDSAQDGARPFIVMEFVNGETLEERIKRGPLELEEAVRIASEIASALEAAHENGIVHRDIKSANVMLSGKGHAKVLDFGLAQTAASTRLTQMGSTVGTVAYMSPEQARGEEVDLRTDLWSLGAVLYEMIAGSLPFPGDYEQAVLYSVLNQDPRPLTALRTGMPVQLEWIVAKCLAKDAGDRYQTATDLLVDLRNVNLTKVGLSVRSSAFPVAPARSPGLSRLTYALIAIAAILGCAVGWVMNDSPPQEIPVRRFPVIDITQLDGVPDGSVLRGGDISPDGSTVSFYTDGRLWIRRLDELEATPIPNGTDQWLFTPDSKAIVWRTGTEFVRYDIETAASIAIATRPARSLGFMVLGDGTVLAASGDTIVRLTTPSSPPDTVAGPIMGWSGGFQVLPNQKGYLVLRRDSNDVMWLSHVLGQTTTPVMEFPTTASFGTHLVDDRGYLVYGALDAHNKRAIYALRMDFETLRPVGDAELVQSSASSPSISAEGTLVYTEKADSSFIRIYENGRLRSRSATSLTSVSWPQLSPNGESVVVNTWNPGDAPIWTVFLSTGGRQPLGDGIARAGLPNWSPDGDMIVFDADGDIYVQPTDPGDAALSLSGPEYDDHATWSPDGNWIVFTRGRRSSVNAAILRTRVDRTGEPQLVVEDSDGAFWQSVSPDGRYILYHSRRNGQTELFVASYPDGRGAQQVSTGGGRDGKWRGDHIYWIDSANNIVSLEVETTGTFTFQAPTVLLSAAELGVPPRSSFDPMWDISADGQTLVVLEDPSSTQTRAIALQNWLATVDFD